jgi:hypothetical protein
MKNDPVIQNSAAKIDRTIGDRDVNQSNHDSIE